MRTDGEESLEVVEVNTDFIAPVVDISSDEKKEDRVSFSLLTISTSSIDEAAAMSYEPTSEMDPSSDGEKCKCMQATCNVSPFLIYSEFVGKRNGFNLPTCMF